MARYVLPDIIASIFSFLCQSTIIGGVWFWLAAQIISRQYYNNIHSESLRVGSFSWLNLPYQIRVHLVWIRHDSFWRVARLAGLFWLLPRRSGHWDSIWLVIHSGLEWSGNNSLLGGEGWDTATDEASLHELFMTISRLIPVVPSSHTQPLTELHNYS